VRSAQPHLVAICGQDLRRTTISLISVKPAPVEDRFAAAQIQKSKEPDFLKGVCFGDLYAHVDA
jgi:hypothetical protein